MRVFVVMISLFSGVISQKNLAPNGTASQSTTYYYEKWQLNLTADLAINGGPTDTFGNGGCSVTWWKPFQRFAWWMLMFPVDTVYVTNVKIYYRPVTLYSFAGYYLYISNSSTTKTDGHLCYHHTGPTPSSAEQNVVCNQLGKYIIFYNERNITNNPLGKNNFAIVELCYIEVNGCYKGWWGSTCSNQCPVTCVSGHCFPGNGSCVWGCNPDNCLGDTCDTATGKCTQGCKIGLRRNYCDKPCAPGTFGNQCSGNCHCVNQTCNPMNGTCPAGGCQRGYKGDNCSTECSLGRYGYNCDQSCDGCLSESCDKEDGICTDASRCKHGWQHAHPWKCDKACIPGTFGDGCSRICHCFNQPCDPAQGTCLAGGCKRGYKGNTCSTECSLGRYGFNCDKSCDGCLSDACDKENGTCNNTSGCKPGWRHGHPKCDEVCDSRTFGNNCSENCYCVIQQKCNKTTGVCPVGGCERGYKGITCSTECSHGYYGYNCNVSCDGCLLDSCERENGVCTDTSGCKPRRQLGQMKKCECVSGTFGNNCYSNCHCVNQPCDPKHGTCPAGGCQRGYKGSTCSTECILGHYGYNCEESCDGCLLNSCDREHGVCTDTTACNPGRQLGELMKCDKACGSGTFGNHCSRKCHCVNQPCDPEDGTCPVGGCERGYDGIGCNTECSSGDYGYDCEHHCRICINSSCERYEGFCTDGCIDGLKGLQCQSSATPQSAGQTTNDSIMNMVYTGVVTVIVSTLMCIIIVLAILRYRRNKTHGNRTKQVEQQSREFNNGAFTNDHPNTTERNTETHYEDIGLSAHEQDETYDTI